MNFTDIFIRRPVFATVLSLVLLLVGAISYSKLTVRQYPRIDDNVITISTTYPGASAQLMEGFVTNPIENAISGIDGIDYLYSNSSRGNSQVSIHFDLGYDINAASSDVNSKVQSTRSSLPTDINDPIIEKKDPNAQPSLYISFTSPTLEPEMITDYILRVVQPQLNVLTGVGQTSILHSEQYAMRIWLDPHQMVAHNVTVPEVAKALSSNNQQSATGYIEAAGNELNVNANTDINTAAQFNNLVIKSNNGQFVRIKDIGKAELGPESTRSSAIINDKNAVVLAITPQSNANPLDVSTVVKSALDKMQLQLPKGLDMKVVWDNSKFIAASIQEVKKSVFEAAIAVIIVIFLFLGSWRVLTIPTATIPLSLIGVCSLMLLMGFSINTLTLLAMVLAIGMVVDDAIVVSENIHRHIEMGKTPLEAALTGAREIRFAIIAMTFTLAAVFAPIGFLTDLTGALFKEFAFTLASAVIISGFIALTLSPMMCSKIMKAHDKPSKLTQWSDAFLKKTIARYQRLLTFATRHIFWVGGIVLVVVLTAGALYYKLPKELAPSEDVGAVLVLTTAPPSANLSYLEKYTQQLIPIFKTVPEMQDYAILNGVDKVNAGLAFIILQPWDQRHRKVPEIIASLFPKVWQIAGIQVFPVNPFSLPGSNNVMPVRFILKTTGTYEELANKMDQLTALVNQNPGFTNVSYDLKFDQPQINIDINRNKAGDLGIPMSDIGQTLNLALGEPQIGHFEMNGKSYDVIPQLAAPFMNKPQALTDLNVRTSSGALVPLSNLVTITESTTPEVLPHFQQQRAATLSASLVGNYALGQALQFLENTSKKIMPSDISYDFGGTSRQFMEASQGIEKTFVFALLFILLVLAAQFESFLDPLIVMFSVIPAIAGALLTLKITGGSINIYTQIGLVTLIGLISKHGILMVEFANHVRDQGKSLQESIISAASTRFRPIMMTTLAMILGAIPLALASGAGALSRQQIGWVIVGGMFFGTMVTLFVVPCAYIAINKLAAYSKRNKKNE